MQAFVDYYQVLEILPTASAADIKKQYHQLAFRSHPDQGGTETAMRRLNDAYSVLSRSDLRTKYDEVYRQFHAAPVSTGTSFEPPYSQVNVKYTFLMQVKDYFRYQFIFDLAWLLLKLLYGILNFILSFLGI